MVNLIIILLAIVLVGFLLILSTTHLGETTTNNGARARVAQILNESQQLMGAVKIYRNDGGQIDKDFTLDTLVEKKYLSDIPKGQWRVEDRHLKTDVNTEVCEEANRRLGFVFKKDEENVYVDTDNGVVIPLCKKPEIEFDAVCCYGKMTD